ncbi:hypothetical protein L484_017925 [Morus notabilis]|uniref:Uncharacterized protein n=1 Tax=Morus notabilis TaxID=981085 RepID=W9RHB9_9ROSA|nr:hypothetical protein L484_017925 [Morus notabilis]
MPPKPAIIPAGVGKLKKTPLDMQQREVNHHGMVSTPERLAHLIQWQDDAAGNGGLKNVRPAKDVPEEKSSHKASKRAAGGINTRRAWHGPLIQRFEEEGEPTDTLSLGEHGTNFRMFLRLSDDPSDGASQF